MGRATAKTRVSRLALALTLTLALALALALSPTWPKRTRSGGSRARAASWNAASSFSFMPFLGGSSGSGSMIRGAAFVITWVG